MIWRPPISKRTDTFFPNTTLFLYNASVNHSDLRALLPGGLQEGQFEVVVANILSNPLKVLAPMLANRVAPGGYLVLSGVLERSEEHKSELPSLMRISYAVFCLKEKKKYE